MIFGEWNIYILFIVGAILYALPCFLILSIWDNMDKIKEIEKKVTGRVSTFPYVIDIYYDVNEIKEREQKKREKRKENKNRYKSLNYNK